MRVKDRESEGQKEEKGREPPGDFGEHIRGLSAENVFGHAAPERGAQALAFRALHQNHEDHEQRDENV